MLQREQDTSLLGVVPVAAARPLREEGQGRGTGTPASPRPANTQRRTRTLSGAEQPAADRQADDEPALLHGPGQEQDTKRHDGTCPDGAGAHDWCCAQVIAGVPHVFTPPSIPARRVITTPSMSSSLVSAIL